MDGASPQKILVVDDHRMFGESLRLLIKSQFPSTDFQHLADAESAFAALQASQLPDIILLDLKLPGVSGQTFLQQLQAEDIWVPILVVSASRSVTDANSVLNSGALGFVCKEASGEELIDAIQSVINGDPYNYFERSRYLSVSDDDIEVTPRQMQVIQMLAQGHANKSIAYELGISEHTVKAHLYEIFRVLKVKNRTACVKAAEQLGLL